VPPGDSRTSWNAPRARPDFEHHLPAATCTDLIRLVHVYSPW
jgi:hypothetical protein